MTNFTRDPLRGTGRTTNRILHCLRVCIDNAGVSCLCTDHNLDSHEHVTNQVCKILSLLDIPYERIDINHVKVEPRKTK